ncbi:MAG: Sua5/YciO/YrdC/YwlC family protein [Actinobacteria bacterium]|nr:MAG: Sua5/YciO/YrdC/YwlC family protein [Actinomycetota bacterium]
MAPLTAAQVRRLGRCRDAGGVALFPADTVYGLACDPGSQAAVARLYELKGRPPAKPAAVLFGALEPALEAVGAAGALAAALRALLPGAVTVLVPNPERRFPLACGPDPVTLGLRVPRWPGRLAALAALDGPVLQSSANLSGGPEPRRLDDVAPSLRAGVELALDGGALPGRASTVVDLRRWEAERGWSVLREGAVPSAEVARALEPAA